MSLAENEFEIVSHCKNGLLITESSLSGAKLKI